MAVFGRRFPLHVIINRALSSATYNVSITESAAATDVQSAVKVLVASITESGSATDTQSALKVLLASITESGSASDVKSAISVLIASIVEAANATDLEDGLTSTLASILEQANATDSQDATEGDFADITESCTAIDTSDGVVVSTSGGGSPLPKKFRHRRSLVIPPQVRVEPKIDFSKQFKEDEEISLILDRVMEVM